jgi:hypothetical protein
MSNLLSTTNGQIIFDLEVVAKKYFGDDEIKAMNDLHSILDEMMRHHYYQESSSTKKIEDE